MRASHFRRSGFCLLGFLLGSLAFVSQAYGQPYAAGHISRTFIDSTRNNRPISASVYYPTQTPGEGVPLAAGSFPVLSLGHGFVMQISAYANFVQELVPAGYILVLPNTETGTSPSHLNFGLDLAFVIRAMKKEGADSGSLFFGHVQTNSAVMGHSMGGGAAFLAADSDTGITALVTFAAAITNPSSVSAAGTVIQPSLVFAGSDDCVTPPLQHQKPMYDSLASPCKAFISITGGGHCYFADYNLLCSIGENLCNPNLIITREQQQDVMTDFLIPWLDCKLKDLSSACGQFQDSLLSSGRITYQQSCISLGMLQYRAANQPCELYPIPFTETARLYCMELAESVEWLDMSGRVLFRKEYQAGIHEDIFHLNSQPAGPYIIRVRMKSGALHVIRGIKTY